VSLDRHIFLHSDSWLCVKAPALVNGFTVPQDWIAITSLGSQCNSFHVTHSAFTHLFIHSILKYFIILGDSLGIMIFIDNLLYCRSFHIRYWRLLIWDFFFVSTKNWIQGQVLTRQVICHLSHDSSPFALSFFFFLIQIGSCAFIKTRFSLQSSFFCLLNIWDYRLGLNKGFECK
jgi:hypothetical protein